MKKQLFLFVLLASCFCFSQQIPDAPLPTFDKQTKFELAISAAAISADLATTRAKMQDGFVEKNSLASPFVKSNSGTVLVGVASFGSEIGAVYLLRRHKILKHLIPLAVTGVEFTMAARNMHQKIRLTP